MGAGAATVGGIASLAGCSSIPVVGSYFEDAPDYTEWAYDPSEMDSTSVTAMMANIESLLDAEGVPEDDRSNMSDNMSERFDGELQAEDVTYHLSVGYSTIFTGSFDPSEVLDAMSLSESDEYNGFNVYENDEESTTYFGTDGDFLLVSQSFGFIDHDGRDELELLIDTYNEDSDRFVDVNEDFELLADELSSGDLVNATGRTEAAEDGSVAEGFTAAIDGEETSAEFVSVYENEDDIDLEQIKTELEENWGEDADIGEPSQDGRVVTVECTFPTEQLTGE